MVSATTDICMSLFAWATRTAQAKTENSPPTISSTRTGHTLTMGRETTVTSP